MHWRQQCISPNEFLDARLGDAAKGALPSLDKGMHAFFCLLSGLQCVGKCVAWIQERWQYNVMLASMGRILGQATHLKARRPALAYANFCLFVSPSLFLFVQHLGGKEMGVYWCLHCAAWYAWRGGATNCAC